MNTKGVLNIRHMRMTCPMLDGNISDLFMDLQAYAQDKFIYCIWC